MKKILLYNIVLFSILSCSSQKEVESKSPFPIEEVYFQKWIAGVQGGGSGINFHVTFKKHLDENFKLKKLKFDAHESDFEQISETEFVARIKTNDNDLILEENSEKEYGNKNPEEFKLNKNEALLIFYNISSKKYYTKRVENVKEKPLLAYPSMGRPKN